MSSNSITQPGQEASPLVVVAAWLENAHHRDDRVVSLPANTSQAIKKARLPGAQHDRQEVQAIVLALEYPNSMVCKRLDSLSLTILCSIFMSSQECLAQQRGLCLLAEALHWDNPDSAQKIAHNQAKKIAMGQAALTLLIKGFLNTEASDKLRRWLGILALELLEDCRENTEKLQSDPIEEKHWQHLGEVIEHGSCQVLKLLAGSMIREILSFGVSPDDFWLSGTRLDLWSKFPKSEHHNSQWVTSFEEFVDGLVLGKILTREVSSVIFAQVVYVGDRKWDLEDASDILVTLSEELNIIVPAKDVNPAVYIDVPLDSILEVFLDKSLVPESQQPTYGLVVQLMGGSAINCILNAIGYAERHVALAFASEKDANTLRRLLMPTNVRTNGILPHIQSGKTDVSEPILSDDELDAPGPASSNSPSLVRIASLPSAIIPHRNAVNAVSTINPSRLEHVHTSEGASAERQEGSASSVVEDDNYPQKVGHIVEMAAEGIDVSLYDMLVQQAVEGIDVSQADGLSNGESQQPDIQPRVLDNASSNARVHYSQASGNGTQQSMIHFDGTSDTGWSSSLQWHTGVNATQNAPGFRVRLPRKPVQSVEPVENNNRQEGQDREHDDLYDASPKVKDGQRRSPRMIARNIAPKRLERLLESTARQASIKTGPPTKLSRQLRNANGVVESRTERTADDDLATSTKNGASDSKTGANSKKSKAHAHAKSPKSIKKTAQEKTKPVAAEEPPNASFDNYDLPPSPTRADSTVQTSRNKKKATSTRLKAKKAPPNNRKQAKRVTTESAAITSSKGPVTHLTKDLKKEIVANVSIQPSTSNRRIGKKIHGDDDAIWDVDKANSDEEPRNLGQSRHPAKVATNREMRATKTEKTKTQTKTRTTRPMRAKPAPTALSQPRTRRTAALKANKKIQGLDESDEIVDDYEVVLLPKAGNKTAPSRAAKEPITQNTRGSNDGRPISGGKLLTQKPSTKNFIPDSVSPDSSEKQPNKTPRPEPVLESKANTSPEFIDFVKAAPADTLLRDHDNESNNLPKANLIIAPEQSVFSLHSDYGKHSPQLNSTSLVDRVKAGLVPGSVTKLQENVNSTIPTHVRSPQDHDVGDHDAMDLTGPEDQDHVEDAFPYIDDVSLQLEAKVDSVEKEVSAPQAPIALVVVEIRQRRTSPRLAEAAQKALPESTAMRGDPFAAKLNASMPKSRDANAKVEARELSGYVHVETNGPNTPEPADLAKPSREPKMKAVDKLEARSFAETKQVKKPRMHLKLAVQVDGEGEDSLIQTLKPAGESTSPSRVETKRKLEQLGNTSHKRVKLALPEQHEGVWTKGKPAYDVTKTPPPVVSNRPLVIGFSTTGPRNQGTISTKMSNPLNDVGSGTPGAMGLRNHDVPNSTIDQVEAGFASVREALEIPSENIQHDLKNTGGIGTNVRCSPQRKESRHLGSVNAVATRGANTQRHRAQKRKLAPFFDDAAPWEHEQLSKRQKRDMETPSTTHNHHPPNMLPNPSPAIIYDRSQRLSSQNTRVNKNGSPMPFLITCNEDIAAEEQTSDEDDGKDALAEARLEEQFVSQHDDPLLPEPTLPLRPLRSAVSISQPKTTARRSLSNNSKQVPSSPHAPSAFGTMPLHHIYHDGEIVNAETKESIVAVKPQDPFLGVPQNPQNPFMNALRKSTEVAAKRLIPGANAGEDPDKTLVETKSRKRYQRAYVSESSSISQSDTSTQASQPDESSGGESDAEIEARWRRGLEPHQDNMLECLLTISHGLIRHLIAKETAIKDMVVDFERRGNSLVEGYEKGLQDYIDSHRANNSRRHQDLVKIVEKAQAARATISKAVVKRHVRDMKAQWETQQEALMEKMSAALAACTE